MLLLKSSLSSLFPITKARAIPLSRTAQLSRFAITVLPSVVAAAKFIFGWAWLWSWPVAVLLLVLALVGAFVGRPLPGWREIAATVVRFGVRRGLVELAKWAAQALWSLL